MRLNRCGGGVIMKIDRYKIELALAAQGLTQSGLAESSDISKQTVCAVLARGTCSILTAGKLAKGLGLTVQEITKED